MTLSSSILLAAVTVGTWNGQWFPSGRAEHRAAPEIEAATASAAGKMLRRGLDAAAPDGSDGVILCLNEMRGPKAVETLCAATGVEGLKVAVVSGYRRRDRFDQQQDAIATTLPVVSSGWSRWKNAKASTPPRGYAYAKILVSPTVTATVYAVHLKSNYRQKGDDEARLNAEKRTLAVRQLIDMEKPGRGRPAQPVIIAGDFNADAWAEEFASDTVFADLVKAGFDNPLSLLPPAFRVTYPGRGRWRNGALDYVMSRGFGVRGPPSIEPADGISDHNALFAVLVPPPAADAEKIKTEKEK